MVGEIRDLETAEIAIQSALTGHLVFSTIHTNNAPATLNRLIDMKVEPFLIASSVNGILAQRLIRLVCSDCKEGYTPAADLIKNLGLPSYGTVFTFYHGKGCDSCKGTGYLGRMGIFEFMTINDQIRELIISRASTTAIRQAARKSGMQTLREDGLQKVLKGQTTIEEVMRATVEEET
jgi:type II secretory ATPase GspE/PulE/Tfp pilus assembly ATPase PilB-like protein